MNQFSKFISVFCSIILWILITPEATAQGTMLLRQPSLSSQNIVFVHGDDLWVVAAEGSDGRLITTAIAKETSNNISHDGKQVEFTGTDDGNTVA